MSYDQDCFVVNETSELSDCQNNWCYNEKYDCWCLEDILYSPAAVTPKFQRMSVYIPHSYMSEPGLICKSGKSGKYTALTAPVVFDNNAAGYMQMPHKWLGGPRCTGENYLARGMVYVTCGCRGRESRDISGRPVGKAPATLIDLKTAIRFLRHNRTWIPGDLNKIISVGTSAGGAMSALLGVTGDNILYFQDLEKNGAFMDESDSVFAAQIYCPIIDLEHADLAYEWMFGCDPVCEDSPAGPAETMTPFKKALSSVLCQQYITYVNHLQLKHPFSGEPLTLSEDGRHGPFYDYLMRQIEKSAEVFLKRLDEKNDPGKYSAEQYLSGDYTYEIPAPENHSSSTFPEKKSVSEIAVKHCNCESGGLGEMLCNLGKEKSRSEIKTPMLRCRGTAKPWLHWDGSNVRISDLDTFVLQYRRRMKPCTSFDKLICNSGENEEFGNAEYNAVHFNPSIGDAAFALHDDYPSESKQVREAYSNCMNKELEQMIYLINPLNFIGTKEKSVQAKHYRIRVGSHDADTSLSVAMTLALKLSNNCCGTVDYAIVWDEPHGEADYPDEFTDWIEHIC